MKANVGLTDKLIRYTIGVVLISLHLSGNVTGFKGTILLLIAGTMLLTALFNYCLIYRMLRWSTRRDRPRGRGKY